MKKNNTAEKSVLDAEKITKALQEGTEKTLRSLVNEAVSKFINEEVDDEEPEEVEDGSYEVEDVDTADAAAPEVSDETPEEGGEEEGEENFADNADDEWSDFEQYKVGDNDYDFTGVNGDELLKVYNKLGDDDQIFVKKTDDGTYEVKDEETGAELVIELNPEAEANDDSEEDFDVSFDDDEEGEDFGGDELADEPSDKPEEDEPSEDPESDDEIEIDLGDDEEENDDDDELNEEDLGYTDSYQKDVFDKKPNMNEPADSKTTNDWGADGAPKGAEKPWAGKGDSQPFDKSVNEESVEECGGAGCAVPSEEEVIDENGGTIASTDARHMKKGQIAQHRPNAPAYDVRKVDSPLNESVKKIVEKAKAIQAENKQYKASIDKIKESLKEAAVLNVNLGKLVDILVNETTTRDEKKSILARFNNVKTIKEGAELHAAIKTELREARKSSTPIVEKQFTVSDKSLNETTIYSNGGNASLNLMERMDNLYKKNR